MPVFNINRYEHALIYERVIDTQPRSQGFGSFVVSQQVLIETLYDFFLK